MDTISPPDASLRACVHAMKHWVSSSGSNRDKTRRKVSCPGMPCGKSSRLANHSAWDLPYSSISSHPSAPPITAHTAMTRISIRRCRLLGAWGQRGSVNVAKCSCNDEGASIPMPSSPVVQKASGGKRFDHFNGKPSQFPNALTLGSAGLPLPIPRDPVAIQGVLLSVAELVAAGIALLCMAVVSWGVQHSRLGIALRAMADDQQAAMLVGIDLHRSVALTWALM